MSIKFTCNHCNKPLKVSDAIAGKKGVCPSCKKPILVPKPNAAPAKKAIKKEIDFDALAAEALADPKPKEVPVVETTTVKVTCAYCDEEVTFSSTLCGKQEPCPACRRIIKVPMLVKQEAKDWR